jgi:ribose-phosphate pyrophosphokinase
LGEPFAKSRTHETSKRRAARPGRQRAPLPLINPCLVGAVHSGRPLLGTFMLLYSLDRESTLALALSRALEEPLAAHEERRFDDGERKWRPLTDPRGQDAYVLASLHGDLDDSPHDKVFRLLSMCATLHAHAAARVTAVIPYLAYARKDARTQPQDPLGTQIVARLLEATGCDEVMVFEPHHAGACENAFRVPLRVIDAAPAFDDAVLALAREDAGATTAHPSPGSPGSPGSTAPTATAGPRPGRVHPRPLVVASPDPGGVKRVLRWRERLEDLLSRPVGFAMVDKRRGLGLVRSGHLVAGDVDGATVLLRDDLIATGSTLAHAAAALRHAGAAQVHAMAAHGLFVGHADRVLAEAALDSLVVSDSVPPFRLPASCAAAPRLHTVGAVGPILAALRDSRDARQR